MYFISRIIDSNRKHSTSKSQSHMSAVEQRPPIILQHNLTLHCLHVNMQCLVLKILILLNMWKKKSTMQPTQLAGSVGISGYNK